MSLPTYRKRDFDCNGNIPETHYSLPTHSSGISNVSGGYGNLSNEPWLIPQGYIPVSNPNTQLRSRPNSLRLPQGPGNYPFPNPYTYPMDMCNGSGNCGSQYLNPVHSPGLKEVLACYNPGATILCVEPKKEFNKSSRWFQISTRTVIICLVIIGIIILGTGTYFLVGLNDRKATLSKSHGDKLPSNMAWTTESPRYENVPIDGGKPPMNIDWTTENPHNENVPMGLREQDSGNPIVVQNKLRSYNKVGGIDVTVVYSKDDDEEASVEVAVG